MSAGPPDIAVTSSGYVLIAYWYPPYVKVHRSTNQGQSYATTLTELCVSPSAPVGPYSRLRRRRAFNCTGSRGPA